MRLVQSMQPLRPMESTLPCGESEDRRRGLRHGEHGWARLVERV